ncbi:uncharacterized protein LOC132716641 [Ruditapes philippinarum]|uniref:uncharacterized protein LOC132716641 n=1 Tax=Ruditapes philippinarum TaxID=129788 RepID=UPI00295AB6B9|nr:uncharacterized protein LOC132716641 [Ruditapes philippinarum]
MEQKEKEVKPKVKKERIQKPKITGQISDKDIVVLANAIGTNWELLGPFLGLSNVEIGHLKMDKISVEVQISHMLQKWKQRTRDPSWEELFSILSKVPSVQVDYDMINMHKLEQDRIPDSRDDSAPELQKPVQTLKYPSSEQAQKREMKVDRIGIKTQHMGQSIIDENKHISKEAKARDVVDAETFENKPATSSNHAISKPVQETENGKQFETDLGPFHITISPSKAESSSKTHTDSQINNLKSSHCERHFEESSNIKESALTKLRGFQSKFSDSRRQCSHDGRIIVYNKEYFHLIEQCCNETIKGAFGIVYVSDETIPDFEIKVAVKKIICNDEKDDKKRNHYDRSTTNEKLASRLMHFAIVPILGMGSDKGMYWFLCPRLDKGDLFVLIGRDTKRMDDKLQNDIELNRQRRLRILYHICAAVDFLHTEIKNFRGAIIHLDVKSSNVVLDRFYNARLTDFGVARETAGNNTSIHTSVSAIPITDGYFNPPTFDKLEKYFDYFNVGVVTRELLTGKQPSFESGAKEMYLKDLDDSELEHCYIQEDIWNDGDELCDPAFALIAFSQKCIESASTSSELKKEEQLTSKQILTETQDLIGKYCEGIAWDRPNDSTLYGDKKNCEMCMVNPSVPNDLLAHKGCNQHLKVCVSCMRNSYLNPLHCHSCFQEIDPIIGSKWGAVLVAGHYDDKTLSDSCMQDVKDVEKVIISKWPLVMGIKDEYVKTIQSSLHNYEDIRSQIQNAFSAHIRAGLSTILFYYTGHYTKENGFVLNSSNEETQSETRNQFMSLAEFKDILRSFSKGGLDESEKSGLRRLIIVLDCPEAPLLCSDESRLFEDMNLVQLNSCQSDQKAVSSRRFFNKAFIQGLTIKSTKEECFLMTDHGITCEICPINGDDFITFGNLQTYIYRHMKALGDENVTEPVLYASKYDWIGYLIHTDNKIKFKIANDGKQKDYTISCNFFTNINQLKEALFDEFIATFKLDKDVGGILQLDAKRYADILRLVIQTGPKSMHKKDLNNLEQVMSAWNGKRDLFVELRKVENIEHGMVGVFKKDQEEPLFSYVNDWEHGLDVTDYQYVYKMDIKSFLKQKKPGFQQMKQALASLIKARKYEELQIVLPRAKDEQGVCFTKDDFLCLKVV